jgi:hypothetical protein
MTTKRMWKGGPLRECNNRSKGRYVCDVCLKPLPGIYRVEETRWLCQSCKGLGTRKTGVVGAKNSHSARRSDHHKQDPHPLLSIGERVECSERRCGYCDEFSVKSNYGRL